VDVSYVAEFTESDVESRKFSSLDLCRPDAFTVIVGNKADWQERFDAVKEKYSHTQLRLNLVCLGSDFVPVSGASSDDWVKSIGLLEGSAVIVRPDQHILSPLEKDASAATLISALSQHLGV
jgi:hypothetical protein